MKGAAPEFASPAVRSVYEAFTPDARAALLGVREMIFAAACGDTRIGEVTETLNWGQASYLTRAPKSGTTIRLATPKAGGWGIYVPCSTSLIEDFRWEVGAGLRYDGTRGIIFEEGEYVPTEALWIFVQRAMLYHLRG